ncbi:MAG TPA: hypothetical protein VLA14_07290 [Polyangia bacterium]|nr:hypothetical protein [Polyangia bacterium]
MTDDTRALALVPVSFDALASAGAGLLRSPVSGQACVYWRVRIAQRLTDRSQLVHEIASEEVFELRWGRGGNGAGDVRVRLAPDDASIQAPPVLHREGTPGADAAALYFGLAGPLSVEETLIRPGEALSAEGVISDLDAAVGAGPLRGTSRGPELLDATVVVETKSLGPVLLPWALGTAAALMSGMGLATYAAWRAHLLTRVAPISATVRMSRLFNAQLQPPEFPHPRLP